MIKVLNELIFPIKNQCLMCNERNIKLNGFICENCYNNLEILHREISIDSPYVDRIYYSLTYNRFIRHMIKKYKYNGKNYLYKPFGQIILTTYYKINIKVDKIAYVPMDRRKEAMRGYNQGKLLADYVSKKTDKPIINNLVKIKSTKEQSHSSKVDRIKNLKDSFRVKNREDINNLRILLIDDIITTGATMEECSRVLLEAGAKEIMGLALTSSKIN